MSSPSKRLFLFALAGSKIREVSFNYFSVLVILTPNLVLLNINRTCLSALVFLLSPCDQVDSSSLALNPTTLPQRERQKKTLISDVKVWCTCITLFSVFYTFLCRFCTTTTWKCLISRFMKNVNKQRRNFISLSEHGYSPLEFNSRRIGQFLTK